MLLGEKITKSKLAPCQRFDALKTFFFPAFVFQMRTEQLSKCDMKIVDDFMRPLIKDTLYLDDYAANDYLYGSTKMVLFGIPKLADEVDIMMIDNAFKLLSSKDIRIHVLAWEDILEHITIRTGLEPSPSLIENVFNGVQDEEGKKVCKTIKESLRTCLANNLIAKPSQGVAIEVSALHPASSHFLRNGDYTSFADWRFIHRARLNLLRLNGNTPWDSALSNCRRCHAPNESTLHVLSLCKPNMGRRTERHNAIVERIHKATRRDWKTFSKNQALGDSRLRPDLVLHKGKDEALILGITIPYENRLQAFDSARAEKERKYANIASLLSQDFKKVSVQAIVVGALGSWDPKNDAVLKKFTNKKYAKLLRKLCVSDAISHSRKIFQKHVIGYIPSDRQLHDRQATSCSRKVRN
ncbi:hypothetical protein JTE90_004034 [Oedothorax gibbosus]|uniref:Reverse transcriptase n=1 Tax=Oedothorax gibbosus TaxID=931172 RepID=A0AAV6U6C1_9ARAC|nr:hypothetical protein JTE90_004034 [Oedothorax gibbosus]